MKENIDTDDPNMLLEHTKLVVDMWKTTIEAQHHFNNMELVVRNFAVTVLVGTITAAGVSLQNGARPLAFWILVAGFVALVVILLTEYGYHRLLQGAVDHSTAIEKHLRELYGVDSIIVKSIILSSTITERSHMKLRKGKSKKKALEIRSTHRVTIFYGILLILLVASITFMLFLWPN